MFFAWRQLNAQVQAYILQTYIGAFSSPWFQILFHGSSDIFRSPLSVLFMMVAQKSSTMLTPLEEKKAVIIQHAQSYRWVRPSANVPPADKLQQWGPDQK